MRIELMHRQTIIASRMERHGICCRARTESEYRELFRRLQPVAPVHFSMPGSPPRLVHRSDVDDGALADRMRACRELVKGRFANGLIAYVLADDLELYATAFRQPLDRLTQVQELVLETLKSTGPLSTRQLREEMGIMHKQLMPALHRLQRAFVLYEDQEDGGWDRPWCRFESEWPEIDLDRMAWSKAAIAVVERFLDAHVFATTGQIHDWCGFGLRKVRQLLPEARLTPCEVNGLGMGWMRETETSSGQGETERAPSSHGAALTSSTLLLHKADPLVRPHLGELRERYRGREVLQFLLIDGELRGAVCGHWRIRAHDVEDVVVDLPRDQAEARREEILTAVREHYPRSQSRILDYQGGAVGRG